MLESETRVPDSGSPGPIEIAGAITGQDVLDSVEIANANYSRLIGQTQKRTEAVQFAKGLWIGLVSCGALSIWLGPILAAWAGFPASTGGWVPFISFSMACWLLQAASADRRNRRRYKALLDRTRPELAGAGASFTLRLAGPRIEMRGMETEQVWPNPAFTRLIEAAHMFVLLAADYVIPIPKRGLPAQLASDLHAWGETYAGGLIAPGQRPRYVSQRSLQIAAWTILAGGLLPPLLQYTRASGRNPAKTVVRIALSGHALHMGGETIELDREVYTASLDQGALREWLAGCSYPGDGSTRFEIERYWPGIYAPPPADELANQQKRFPDRLHGVPADAVASPLPNDGVLITWSTPPSGNEKAKQCAFVRIYAEPIYHGAASWPIYGRTTALWSCSPSLSSADVRTGAIDAAPLYARELDDTTQTAP